MYFTFENFVEFKDRIIKPGFGELELLMPMMYWDVTFWDFCLWSDDTMSVLERSIHEVLFPNIPFQWVDYCAVNGLDPSVVTLDKKWRNAKCDVQAFWSHAYRKRDVFVTSDRNFHAGSKKPRLLSFAGGTIETPESAVRLLHQRDGGT